MIRCIADARAMEGLGAGLAGGLAALAEAGAPTVLVFLRGPLGAGKTTLARGILRALGIAGTVRSPTYTLVEPYEGASGVRVTHVDLYRLAGADEVEDLGLRDVLAEPGVVLVEWPERGARALPPPDLVVDIAIEGTARRVTLTAASARAAGRLGSEARSAAVAAGSGSG